MNKTNNYYVSDFKAMNDAFDSSSVIHLEQDYNVIPNNRNEEKNNDKKLSRMRLDVEKSLTKAVTILLPNDATLHYTKNLWIPYGKYCRRVQLIGDKSTLQCNNVANPSGNDGAIGAWAWGTADHFSPYDYDHVGNGTQASFGYRFETTLAGNINIKLAVKSDIVNFKPGNRVFLHGKNKQNLGYPPNLEYHEYNIVDSVDFTTGTLFLKLKLKHSYNYHWHDIAPPHNLNQSYGKPRIVNLDDNKKSFALDYFRVIDVHHALSAHFSAPGLTSQYMTSQAAMFCEFVRCSSDGQMGIGQNEYARLIDCKPTFIGDIDKLLGRVLLKGVKTRSSIEPATGADYVFIENVECGSHIRLASKHFDIQNLDIYNTHQYGGVVIEPSSTNYSGKINNVTLHYEDKVIGIINIPLDRRFSPDSAVPHHIYSNVTRSSANNRVLSLLPGDIITDDNQLYWARIRSVIYDDSKSRFDIEHSSSHTYTSEVILIPSGTLIIDNLKVISSKFPKYEDMLWKIPFYQHQHPNKNAVFEGILDGKESYRASLKYVGVINKIRFTLISPARSKDNKHIYELSISDRGDYYFSPIKNIKKIFSNELYNSGSFIELNFITGQIHSSEDWNDTGLALKNISSISRVCTFMFLDVVKPQNNGGGGLTYNHWTDCPKFKIEIWGSPIVSDEE